MNTAYEQGWADCEANLPYNPPTGEEDMEMYDQGWEDCVDHDSLVSESE